MFHGHWLFVTLGWFWRSHLHWLVASQPQIPVELPLHSVCPEYSLVLEVSKQATWTSVLHISSIDFWLLFLKGYTGNYTEYSCMILVTNLSLSIQYTKPALNSHDFASSSDARYHLWRCSSRRQVVTSGNQRISGSSLLPWKDQNKAWIRALQDLNPRRKKNPTPSIWLSKSHDL